MSMRPELRRRGGLLAACLIATAVGAGCGEVHPASKLGPARALTVAIDGEPSALFGALYTAKANGDFARGALAVTIERPRSGALSALQSGRVSIAVVSEPALLEARDGGAAIVAIGALVGQPLEGIVSLARQPITTVGSLAGRTLAISPTRLAAAELATALANAHLAPARVRQISLGGDLNRALSSRRAVATLGGDWAIDATALGLAHQRPYVLEIGHAGVPSYGGLVLVARVSEVRRDGPLLRAFLQSLTRGQRATAANPAGAAATLARVNPRLSAGFERALLGRTLPLASPRDSTKPFGYQDPLDWRVFATWMAQHGLIAHAVDGSLALTNEFLPGQGA